MDLGQGCGLHGVRVRLERRGAGRVPAEPRRPDRAEGPEQPASHLICGADVVGVRVSGFLEAGGVPPVLRVSAFCDYAEASVERRIAVSGFLHSRAARHPSPSRAGRAGVAVGAAVQEPGHVGGLGRLHKDPAWLGRMPPRVPLRPSIRGGAVAVILEVDSAYPLRSPVGASRPRPGHQVAVVGLLLRSRLVLLRGATVAPVDETAGAPGGRMRSAPYGLTTRSHRGQGRSAGVVTLRTPRGWRAATADR